MRWPLWCLSLSARSATGTRSRCCGRTTYGREQGYHGIQHARVLDPLRNALLRTLLPYTSCNLVLRPAHGRTTRPPALRMYQAGRPSRPTGTGRLWQLRSAPRGRWRRLARAALDVGQFDKAAARPGVPKRQPGGLGRAQPERRAGGGDQEPQPAPAARAGEGLVDADLAARRGQPEQHRGGDLGGVGQLRVGVQLGSQPVERLGAAVVLEEEVDLGIALAPAAVAVGADDAAPAAGAGALGPPGGQGGRPSGLRATLAGGGGQGAVKNPLTPTTWAR